MPVTLAAFRVIVSADERGWLKMPPPLLEAKLVEMVVSCIVVVERNA